MNDEKRLDENIINGSRFFIENGEVKTVLSEEIQKTGYMSVEEIRDILHTYVNNLEKIINKNEVSC